MISLLNPLSLWLGALVAIPLVIHFLGRQRPKKQPFPSLLLVREHLAESMRRHRLKNLLLLLIRMLILACLLFALSQPVFKHSGFLPGQSPSVFFLYHNGIYAKVHNQEQTSMAQSQQAHFNLLDSLSRTKAVVVQFIESESNSKLALERYGDTRDAVERLIRTASSPGSEPRHLLLPVFSWDEMMKVVPQLSQALASDARLNFSFIDYTEPARLSHGFSNVSIQPPSETPLFRFYSDINPAAGSFGNLRLKAYVNELLVQEKPLANVNDPVELELQADQGMLFKGRLNLETPQPMFGTSQYYFSFPNPGSLNVWHLGSSMTSLPSQGKPAYFRRIEHLSEYSQIISRLQKSNRSGRNYVVIADERIPDAGFFATLREMMRNGSRVVVITGNETNINSLNRHLLQPLEAGRIGVVKDLPSPEVPELSQSTMNWLDLEEGHSVIETSVNKQFTYTPGNNFEALVSTSQGPVLGKTESGKGSLLLWLTDLDDLSWTELGLSPWHPLINQKFQNEQLHASWENITVSSDSVLYLPSSEYQAPLRVQDPKGEYVTAELLDGGSWKIGPFDLLGHYNVQSSGDSLHLAVNLAVRPPDEADEDDLKDALDPYSSRIRFLDSKDSQAEIRKAYTSLWEFLVLAAILLILAESLISRRFGSKTNG